MPEMTTKNRTVQLWPTTQDGVQFLMENFPGNITKIEGICYLEVETGWYIISDIFFADKPSIRFMDLYFDKDHFDIRVVQ